MSKTVKMHEAKTNLSQLVREVASGAESEIIISVGEKPAARLVPLGPSSKRTLGLDAGLYEVPDDFDTPDEEIRALFEDGAIFPKGSR